MKFDDQPIKKSDEDKLYRKAVAGRLSSAIKAYKRNESFVIGIQGEWGDGKTSFINMALSDLTSDNSKEKYIIVNFNPWYFTGDDQILKQFCNLLSEKLSTNANGNQAIIDAAKNIKKIAALVKPLKDVVNFAGLSIGVPGIGSVLGATAEKAATFARDLEEAYQPTEDLTEIKQQIETALENFDKKIIVIIDDIDRLNRDEIYEVFRLVKIIADFPKTIYVLSYDKKRVTGFLKEKGYDSNFIDKIVQQELSLPKPSREAVQKIFIQGLDEIIDEHSIKITEREKQYYGEINYAGLGNAFTNLRSVKRALNIIYFEYGLLKNEVNFLDFCLISLFRVYAHSVYEHIRDYGENYLNGWPPKDIEIKENYKKFKNSTPANESWAIPIVETMFPVLSSDAFNTSFGSDIVSQWVVDKRIATDEYFKRYFVLTVPQDEVSESIYMQIYDAASNRDEFKHVLEEHKKNGDVGKLLARLRARTENFPEKSISTTISILLDEADYIDEERNEFFAVDADDQAFYLSLNLLKTVPTENKAKTVTEAIDKTETATNHLIRFIHYIGQDHNYLQPSGNHVPLPKDQTYLSKTEFEALLTKVLKRIAETDVNTLIERQSFTSTWFTLLSIDKDLAADIRQKILETDNGFLRIVGLFCGKIQSSHAGIYRKVSFEALSNFLEKEETEEELKKRIEEALKSSKDKKLNELVSTSLDNAKDPMK